MKNLTIIALCVFGILMTQVTNAQQIGYSSQFNESVSFWNPATSAPTTFVQTDAFFRQQWIGFNGAPQTTYASLMFPLIDYNMSLGGILYNDSSGAVSRTGIKINYAYKLREFITDNGLLAFGISANMQQFRFNGNDQSFVDAGDNIITEGKNNTFFPSIGGGIYFNTNPKDFYREENSFYFGLAFNQIYATNVLVDSSDFDRTQHLHFLVGGKIMGEDSYIEPSLSANYVSPSILNYNLTLKYEKENTFWAGLGYSSVSDVSIQGGYIMDRFLGNRYAKLRVGALANTMLTEYSKDLNPGVEVFIRYEVDLE